MAMSMVSYRSTKRLAMARTAQRRLPMACMLVMVCSVEIPACQNTNRLQAHGQEWLLRENTIAYRTLGGSFDLYFLSGQKDDGSSSALTTISQFQVGCIGTPAMQVSLQSLLVDLTKHAQMYWTFGFHQARWGYENISVDQSVVDGYRQANIPLECLWNDLDIYDLYRDFTNNDITYPLPEFTKFIESLHTNGQYVSVLAGHM